MQHACLALLREHEREDTIPTNGRFLFYELEQRGIVPKAYRDAAATSARPRLRKTLATLPCGCSDATMRLRQLGLEAAIRLPLPLSAS